MYYSTIFLIVFTIGISNVISLEAHRSNTVLDALFDALDSIPDSMCNFFNNAVGKWRSLAPVLTEADVDFYPYYNSDESDDSEETFDDYEDTSEVSNYFSWSEDDTRFNLKINRTVIIIHGYLDSYENNWMQSLKDALLNWRKNNMAVVLVDWSKSFNYHTCAGAVDEVANQIYEKLIDFAKMYDKKSIKRPYLHIMGHSLGAHIAGLTAKKLKEKFNWFVNRVTGFDPAKPFFNIGDDFEEYRLHKSHAQFVDVIHTNSAPHTSTFGIYDALGHLDFYPNGGDNQPVCVKVRGKESKSKKSNDTCPESDMQKCLSGLGNDVSCLVSAFVVDKENMICDHALAHKYFEQSLRGKYKYSAVKFHNTTNNSNIKCNDKCCKKGKISMGIYASHCGNSIYNGQYVVDVTNNPIN